jgi:prepilin-type N-terminal cleavage/methylation domain-containing protein
MKKRKGFTLIELMIVIAIIIILAAIAIPNYLRMTDRARRSRVAGDFTALATANEAYLVDWGYYPMGSAISDQLFGKVDMTGTYVKEITGSGATHNAPSNTTLTGEAGGIEYIKAGAIGSMYNPFAPNTGYYYSCTDTGSHWVLYVIEKTTPATTYLYRTDMVTDLTETTTKPVPPS